MDAVEGRTASAAVSETGLTGDAALEVSAAGERGARKGHGDMTQGAILPSLVLFALPILLTNFFQQLYVTVDSMILGQWSGNVALAAVSSCGFLTATIICFFNGLAVGAGVVLAQLFGSRDTRRFGRCVWTAGALSLVGGVAACLVCFAVARPCLALMNLEGEVLEQAVLYMRVYAVSTLPMVVYNMGASAFRAHGDSRTPMTILVGASVVNLVLALLFVAVMDMGVFGAALGTVVAQALSAAAMVVCAWTRRSVLHIDRVPPTVDRTLLRRMLGIGVPNGVQMTVICLSSVIISSQINLYGLETMDGFGAYSKIDGWLYMPIGSIQNAIVTFVGQNIGAHDFLRARRGVWVGLALNVVVTVALCLAMWGLRYPVLGLFSPDSAVVREGIRAMAIIVPLYFVYAIYMSVCGLYYGVGSTMVPMMFALAFMCVLRIAWVLAAQAVAPSPEAIYMSYPVAWFFMVASMFAYYVWGCWNYKDEIRGAVRVCASGDSVG